jgi:N-acetylmuramoyl-L-alanine amidase
MFIFTKKNEIKIKQNILKGVFEDNLRIIGKGHARMTRSRPFFLRRTFLSLLLIVTAVLLHGNFFNTAFSPEKELTASILSPNLPDERVKAPVDNLLAASDYKAFVNNQDASLSRLFGLGVKTIMIDAGHGGSDSGTIGKMGTMEKDITLDIAERLKKRLLKAGHYRVLMTRDDDSAVSLNERVNKAQAARADLFISIHLNYLPAKPINIIETFYFGPTSDDKIRELAEKENAGSEYALSDFREMIGKIGETMKLQESREFAASIQKNLFVNSRRDNGNIYDFGVKRAPFVVLLGVDVPAVLAEVSCLSNSQEEKELSTESHRENIAHYLEAGILDYLSKGEFTHEAKR